MSEPRLIDQYLRVAEAAKELGISRATLLKLCRARQIAHIELCGRYVFRRARKRPSRVSRGEG